MPDLIVSPTVQTLTVTPTVQSLTLDDTPQVLMSVSPNAAQTSLANDTTLTAGSFVTLLSFTLTAGQWFLFAEVDIYSSTGTPVFVAQLSDAAGSTVYGSGEAFVRVTGSIHLSISGYVSLASSDIVALRVYSDLSNKVAKASTQTQTSAKATSLRAIKVTI